MEYGKALWCLKNGEIALLPLEDVNGDGKTNSADVSTIYNYVIDEHSGANGYIAHSWRGKWIVNKEKAEFRRFPTYDGSLFEVVTEDIIKFVGKGTTYKEK